MLVFCTVSFAGMINIGFLHCHLISVGVVENLLIYLANPPTLNFYALQTHFV